MRQLLISVLLIASAQVLAADMCSKGLSQSPVNIDMVHAEELPNLDFMYQTVDMHVYNDMPNNFYAYPDDTIVLSIDTTRYPLTNIHMHNPSEHRINGHQFPLEIHFVHTSLEGNEIIVSQFAVIGKSNPNLAVLLTSFARGAVQTKETSIKFALNPLDLIAPASGYYKYQGSETYPPCLENATWYVMKDVIEIGAGQAEVFRHLAGVNSRIPQPLNGRSIYTPE
jgi:carbonic anhydrase